LKGENECFSGRIVAAKYFIADYKDTGIVALFKTDIDSNFYSWNY
jgi:hypothetical protein